MAVLWISVIPASVTPAQAWIFHDGPAFAQRLAQLIQVLGQWNQIIRSSGQQLMAFKAAYLGLKDWRNYGWIDVLRVADSPWFDGIKGIDDLRKGTNLTIMSAEQAQQLWDNYSFYNNMLLNPRYEKDPWYRAKVNSLLRQSKRAQAVKASILQQFKAENKDLIEDVKKIKRIKTDIQEINKATPVDATKLASLQAELTATEAKFQGNSLILKNQQSIMFLMGENDAQGCANGMDICIPLWCAGYWPVPRRRSRPRFLERSDSRTVILGRGGVVDPFPLPMETQS